MTKSYADLLREARVADPRGEPVRGRPSSARRGRRRPSSTSAKTPSGSRATSPAPSTSRKSYLEQQIEAAVPDRDQPAVVLYCAGGVRSLFAGQTLQEMGYTDVDLDVGWLPALEDPRACPGSRPPALTGEQKLRYSRHLLIPEVGIEGQAKLLGSKVLFIGAGGLGSPAMLYLAAAGVGTIGIVDFDVVDLSNLQRQIVHTNDRVGEKKVDSARRTIKALNPEVTVVGHEEMLVADNVERIIAGYDVIVDGTDTFETRYLLNDAAVSAASRSSTPASSGSRASSRSSSRTTARATAASIRRRRRPSSPPAARWPASWAWCPGSWACSRRTRRSSSSSGSATSLAGRLLLFDALDASFSELKLRRDPACPVCSDAAVAARAAGRPLAGGRGADGGTFALGGPVVGGGVRRPDDRLGRGRS